MDRLSGWLTAGAFAALCGTTKETLRHYRDLDLLVPVRRGENGYGYYDAEQFYDFYAIAIFRQTGTPLTEIRRCLQDQSAGGTLALLREQRERLGEERRRMEEMDFVLSQAIANLELADGAPPRPCVRRFPAEHLLALPVGELEGLMAPGDGENDRLRRVLERCRRLCQTYGMQADYQLGAIHRPGPPAGPETITHLYTRLMGPADCPYYREKPAGDYLCLCCRGHWDLQEGYDALWEAAGGKRTTGSVYACDLAGFILNSVEKNAVSLLSVRLE